MKSHKYLIYVDSSVLVNAARLSSTEVLPETMLLDNPDVSFASSIFVKLEVMPKAIFHGNELEARIYRMFFDTMVSHWAKVNQQLIDDAFMEASKCGLSAMDALHIVSAVAVGADELVTSEKPSKPIHRTRLIPVRSIHP